MKPFDDYPRLGRELLGGMPDGGGCLWPGGPAAHNGCAYCGRSLAADHRECKMICVDHVVPVAEAVRLGVPDVFCRDAINLVLCCRDCCTAAAGFVVPDEWRKKQQFSRLEHFLEIRDRAFLEKRRLIAEHRIQDPAHHHTDVRKAA